MPRNTVERDDPLHYLRLLRDPDEYAAILGISMKDAVFGPLEPGPAGNEALRKSLERMFRSNRWTAKAFFKFRAFAETRLGSRLPDPSDPQWKTGELGSWAIAVPIICDLAPHTFKALHKTVLASNRLQSVARDRGIQAFAAELRNCPDSALAALLRECAQRVEQSNSADFKRAMAPVHTFFASMLVFSWLLETAPNRDVAMVSLRHLVCGEAGRRGPRLALARWMDTAQKALGFQTKRDFFGSLTNHLDERIHPQHAENSRIEWTKVSTGKRIPALPYMQEAFARSAARASRHQLGGEVHQRLLQDLCYACFVSRCFDYLDFQNEVKARKVFLIALAEVESA